MHVHDSSQKRYDVSILNSKYFHYIHSMKCRIILELLAILFFTGCYNREQISRLDEAEALLQNKPDSALTILQQLKSEGGQAEQARYALLYSEALDKNHIKATNDSLIRRAWEPLQTSSQRFTPPMQDSLLLGKSQTACRRQAGSVTPLPES